MGWGEEEEEEEKKEEEERLIRCCCNGLEFGGPFELTAMTGTVAASQTGQTVGSAPHQTRSCEIVGLVGTGRRFGDAEARMGQ